MKYLRIPLERIGVLIGPHGETKKLLESNAGVDLEVDSKLGEIIIDDRKADNPVATMKLENVIKAIGRGFSPENAMALFHDDADFFIFDLHEYVGKKESHLRRLRSRIIGKEGKTRRVLEELTNSHISVYGHTIAVIADLEDMPIIKKAIDMLLSGSKHATVYRHVESQMKALRLQNRLGF